MELRRASAAVEPEEIGTRSRTPRGMSDMRRLLAGRRSRQYRTPVEGRVRDGLAQGRSHRRVEQLQRVAVLGVGESARVRVQVDHRVPELLVVAVHLVDDLLRAADQGGAAL